MRTAKLQGVSTTEHQHMELRRDRGFVDGVVMSTSYGTTCETLADGNREA